MKHNKSYVANLFKPEQKDTLTYISFRSERGPVIPSKRKELITACNTETEFNPGIIDVMRIMSFRAKWNSIPVSLTLWS